VLCQNLGSVNGETLREMVDLLMMRLDESSTWHDSKHRDGFAYIIYLKFLANCQTPIRTVRGTARTLPYLTSGGPVSIRISSRTPTLQVVIAFFNHSNLALVPCNSNHKDHSQ
jgi:hypothetical protein